MKNYLQKTKVSLTDWPAQNPTCELKTKVCARRAACETRIRNHLQWFRAFVKYVFKKIHVHSGTNNSADTSSGNEIHLKGRWGILGGWGSRCYSFTSGESFRMFRRGVSGLSYRKSLFPRFSVSLNMNSR